MSVNKTYECLKTFSRFFFTDLKYERFFLIAFKKGDFGILRFGGIGDVCYFAMQFWQFSVDFDYFRRFLVDLAHPTVGV